MRIVVCIKHGPESQDATFDGQGHVIRDADAGINELDAYALEAGVAIAQRLRGEGYPCEAIALTMGPSGAVATLRSAFAAGADEGIHLRDDALAGADVHGTALALAAAIGTLNDEYPVGLVLAGLVTADGGTAMVPTLLAAHLGWPSITRADQFELNLEDIDEQGNGVGTIHGARFFAGVSETLSAPLPAVASITDQANAPRFPRGDAIKAARAKEYRTWSLADVGLAADAFPGARQQVTLVEPTPPPTDRYLTSDADAAAQLVDFLTSRGVL